jgi:hypothetical protein
VRFTIRWLLLASLVTSPRLCSAQRALQISGSISASETRAPLIGAVVTALQSHRSASTDRLGRFSIRVDHIPDTLVAGFIGRQVDSVALTSFNQEVRFELPIAHRRLADMTVTAKAFTDENASLGTWRLSLSEIRAVPPAVESDAFRSLSLVPAVSFSTPLSARPMIRGYDAGESSLRIDGYEVLNLYHIGRAFAAFPADAAQEVSVSAAPPSVSEGGTLSGIVDITGRGGTIDHMNGGTDLSLVSASGWLGKASESVSGFGAARLVHLSTISAVSSQGVPYNFQDFYSNVVFGNSQDGPRAKLTAFASRDHVLDRGVRSGMDWSNLLLGSRVRVLSHGATSVTTSASASRFAEDATDIAAHRSRLDIANRFSRLSAGAEIRTGGSSSRLLLGTSVGLRDVANRVTPQSGNDFSATDLSSERAELSGYAEWSPQWQRTELHIGARIDAAGSASVVQPRFSLHRTLGNGTLLGLGAGRSGRLFDLVSDAQSQPDVAFYDFWLSAGEGGVPIPKVDHAVVDLDGGHGSFAWRISAYVSKATGLAELQPISSPVAEAGNQFRFGKGRTSGLEFQLGLRPAVIGGNSISFLYVFSRSERNWNGAWIPWSQDRRHLARLFANARLSRRWTIFGMVEGTSAAPLTPVEQVVLVSDPGAGGGDSLGTPAYQYGSENSARGLATVHADVGAHLEFKGLGHSHATLGFSVINVGFGPVSPVSVSSPLIEPGQPGGPDIVRVKYDRLFDLPAIPTVTFRMEF